MPTDSKTVIRCAIYTRKSSEEGLDQSFNSLEAQREACEAYITSQKHERWRGITTHYDDGGYSGGSMDRPALRQLLADIDAGKVDTVVVYKVDRLTRSLADFAKIIERFDAGQVSFVSVTQQFNTTTSMGRLTLNVLLSFAQFEREVTGERIRDKIAASKRKGMWMGGIVPVGYDVRDRKLIVNADEAAQVRKLFRLYLELGCVAKLKAQLDRDGVKSKARLSPSGMTSGGTSYSRGSLYCLLQNPIYLGKIQHRGATYAGEHDAIIPQELWDKVQDRLRANNKVRRSGSNSKSPSLLVGLLYDEQGNRFTPSHAVKRGKRYRYYVSQAVIHHRATAKVGPTRIPAQELEGVICRKLQALLSSAEQLLQAVGVESEDAAISKALIIAGKQSAKVWLDKPPIEQREFLSSVIGRIVVRETSLEIVVLQSTLRGVLLGNPSMRPTDNEPGVKKGIGDVFKLTIDSRVKRCGAEVRLLVPTHSTSESPARPIPSLIKAVARAHRWPEQIIHGELKGRRSIARLTGLDERYAGRILDCAFLAPDIVEAILDGCQPVDLGIQKLLKDLPLDWIAQRQTLGFL
ncbi:MAG TPA: recombinase family protein [Terriglobales bacterium]|jgi:DNA invertase Pin-like site-specific DNA recombinase|nr:recombinase family protein [Terriglobales bacterium]